MPTTGKLRDSKQPPKPAKPRPDFPLYPHASGRWAKRVRGSLCYFGKWADDPKGVRALEKWLDEKDDLLAGRKPRVKRGGLTVRDLVNQFLNAKRALVDNDEMTARTWRDYYAICEKLIAVFGKGRSVDDLQADDFDTLRAAFAKTHGLVALKADLTHVRAIFNWAAGRGLIERREFATLIRRPGALALRRERAAKGRRVFSSAEVRALHKAAGQPLQAMILLGINAGYGNGDVAMLTLDHVDLAGGWVDMPRAKNGNPRRMKLWPETVAAIRDAMSKRPKPHAGRKDLAKRLFLTAKGHGWEAKTKTLAKAVAGEEPKLEGYENNPLSKEFAKLLKSLDLQRPGNGFYSLRRMFATIGGATQDQVAVDFAMGHVADQSDMAARYRQFVDDSRLVALANHIRKWLWKKPPAQTTRKDAK